MASENKHNTDFDQLYKKYLLEDCSEEERAILLDLLLGTDDQERWDVEDVLAMSDEAITLSERQTASIYQHITGERLQIKTRVFTLNFKLIAVAAMFIGMLCAGLYWWKSTDQVVGPYQELSAIRNTTKFVKAITLRDGTKVLLKQGARLAVLSDFESDTVRRVKVDGEVYFEVAKNPNKAFCVLESGAFDVRVLGTAFNFVNLPSHNNLVLTHGLVQVSHAKQQQLVNPGEGVIYNKRKQAFEKSTVDTVASMLWTYSFLSFDREPLVEIFDDLNSLYPEAHLILHEDNKGLLFTGYLPANDLEKSIEILNKTFNKHIISKR